VFKGILCCCGLIGVFSQSHVHLCILDSSLGRDNRIAPLKLFLSMMAVSVTKIGRLRCSLWNSTVMFGDFITRQRREREGETNDCQHYVSSLVLNILRLLDIS
jgi:hypothetical protein